MDRKDVAYVLNSTPKYYWLCRAHIGLVRKYAKDMQWPFFMGTELPEHPILMDCFKKYAVQGISLKIEDSGFWESRIATVEALPPEIDYVFPMQEDFLLEKPVDWKAIEEALELMDSDKKIISARVMPCPGPVSKEPIRGRWGALCDLDVYKFTFQATLWRRDAYVNYLKAVVLKAKELFPGINPASQEWSQIAIHMNLAEAGDGVRIFRTMFKDCLHLAWIRYNPKAEGVYDSPWPYRPTAIIRSVLQSWAKDLLLREEI